MVLVLPLASSRLSKLWIPFQNNLIDGDLCKNFFYFHIFSFFLIFKMILPGTSTLACFCLSDMSHGSRLFTGLLCLSVLCFSSIFSVLVIPKCGRVRSDLLQTYYILVLLMMMKIDENWWKSRHSGRFKYDLMMISESGLLFWAILYGQSVSHLICLYTHRQHVSYFQFSPS